MAWLFLSLFGDRNLGRQDIRETNCMLSVHMLVSRYRQTTKKADFFFSWSVVFDGGSLFGVFFGGFLFAYLRGSGDGLLSPSPSVHDFFICYLEHLFGQFLK